MDIDNTNNNANNKAEIPYNTEDQKLIISLLKDYSERLINISDQIVKLFNRFLLALTVVAFLFSAFILFFALPENSLRDSYQLLGSFLFLTLILIVLMFAINELQRLALLKREAKATSYKLGKIIRAASQIEEHAISNFVKRIELDLRLADAESALEHYQIVMKQFRMPFWKL